MTNPYASLLGDRDAIAVMRETPAKLRKLADQLGAAGLERSLAPGKWPAKHTLSHLADCDIAFGFRLRQAYAETNHVVQPFDQDKWAPPYDQYSPQQALEVFTVLRGWNLAFLKSLKPEDFQKKVRHPERGEMVIQTIVDTIAGHDINHLNQLEAIAAHV